MAVRMSSFARTISLINRIFAGSISQRQLSETYPSRNYAAATPGFTVESLKNLTIEAEKVVGYPTSLIRYLLSDEISSALIHSKKLVGSRHPLVKTARRLVYEGSDRFEAIGLIVLLVSRMGEPLMMGSPPLGHEHVGGVLRHQRKLAEIAETINAGYMVHLGVINQSKFQPSDDAKIMNFGNKISILSGDFLLAKASVGLGELENTDVVQIMAEVIGDIVEGEILKDNSNLESLEWPDWEQLVFKSRGSLFAKSCMSVLKLGSLSQMHQDAVFSFGKNLAFLQQLHRDQNEIISSDKESVPVTNAAVILAKNNYQSNLDIGGELGDSFLLRDEKLESVIIKSGAFAKMQEFCNNYSNIALANLELFPQSEAKGCLKNLVKHLQTLQIIDK